MKKLKIESKTHGIHYVLLDNADYERVVAAGGHWCVSLKRGRFYAQKRFSDGKIKEIQRFILNPEAGKYVDHINRDTLDNRRQNLRICSNAANIRNGKVRTNNRSGATGVNWVKDGKKWEARIRVHYKTIILGRFNRFADAVMARRKADEIYFSI